jgi:hypothetical protein
VAKQKEDNHSADPMQKDGRPAPGSARIFDHAFVPSSALGGKYHCFQ